MRFVRASLCQRFPPKGRLSRLSSNNNTAMAPMIPYATFGPILLDAKDTWEWAENFMGWFDKFVIQMYVWSDGIIKSRQMLVDKEYKLKKIEREARIIMKEQYRQEREQKKGPKLGKRSESNVESTEEFLEYLESLER
jgi:hypothetical protein